MINKLLLARLGAICYLIWGSLHLKAAQAVYLLGAGLPAGMVQGRLYQDAWICCASPLPRWRCRLTLNWRNSVRGYWINLGVISVADLGFIFFVLVPGYIDLFPGILGPAFWILGWLLASIAYPRSSMART